MSPKNSVNFKANQPHSLAYLSILAALMSFSTPQVMAEDTDLPTDEQSDSTGAEKGDRLMISPYFKNLSLGNTYRFSSSGGKRPYRFSIVSGGGTINPSTGDFTASSNITGTTIIKVRDALGNIAKASIMVRGPLKLSVPNTKVETGGLVRISAIGGVGGYLFSIPSGIGTINHHTGAYTAPETPGVAAVQVKDSMGNSDVAILNIYDPVRIKPSKLTLSRKSDFNFKFSGGTPPYSFQIESGGVGSIDEKTGVFHARAYTGPSTILITDVVGNKAKAEVTVVENLAFNLSQLTLVVRNSFDFKSRVAGGIPPYTFSVEPSQGSLKGTVYTAPNEPGTYTVSVTDSQEQNPNTTTLTVTVNPELTIKTESTTLAKNAKTRFSVTGGVPPYTFSIQSGEGTINESGEYSAPNSTGKTSIRVGDAYGNFATATISVEDLSRREPLF